MAKSTISANSPARANDKILERIKSYLSLHQQEAKLSAVKMRNAGSSSLLTALVIAIALALPTGLFVLLGNVQGLVSNWGGQSNITLFVNSEVSDKQALSLMVKLGNWPEIGETRYVDREEALRDFKQSSGLEDILASLQDNPLPAAIVLKPKKRNVEALTELQKRLESLDEIDSVVVDTNWIARLNAMLSLGRRFIMALAVALCGAVLLVVFNTIRLSIANRQEEIMITKLVGATDAFVRRPFLYTGVWYGLAGGVMALVLVEILVILLQGPVLNLATLYQSDYRLQGISIMELLLVPAVSVATGLLGAWLAVSNHLQELKPK